MKGFTLMEILVTLAILGVLLLNLTLMLDSDSPNNEFRSSFEEEIQHAVVKQVLSPSKEPIALESIIEDCVRTAEINAGGYVLISSCQK